MPHRGPGRAEKSNGDTVTDCSGGVSNHRFSHFAVSNDELLDYSQIRLMVHRIMVQSVYWFKSSPERNGGLLSKPLLDSGSIYLLVQFLLDKTTGPLSGLDCI